MTSVRVMRLLPCGRIVTMFYARNLDHAFCYYLNRKAVHRDGRVWIEGHYKPARVRWRKGGADGTRRRPSSIHITTEAVTGESRSAPDLTADVTRVGLGRSAGAGN